MDDFTLTLPGLSLKNVSLGVALLMILLWLGLVACLGFGFMHLWAWYVPVFWADAPILGFWHSLVTMLLLMLFLRRGDNN